MFTFLWLFGEDVAMDTKEDSLISGPGASYPQTNTFFPKEFEGDK